jgi:hypothetical protein
MSEIILLLITTDILMALAVWRVSVLFIDDNWPFNIMLRLRTLIGVYDLERANWVTEFFSCMYCVSLWASALLLLGLYLNGTEVPYPVIRWLGYSGAAVIIDYRMTGRERSAR